MPRNLQLQRIDSVIERHSFDRRLEHRPESPAATSRPAWLHDLDPVAPHRAFGLQSNHARSGLESSKSAPKILKQIGDRDFDRFSRPDRAVELASHRDGGGRTHRIEHRRDPARRLIDPMKHRRAVSSGQGGPRKPTELPHEPHVDRTQRLQRVEVEADRLDGKSGKTSHVFTRRNDPIVRWCRVADRRRGGLRRLRTVSNVLRHVERSPGVSIPGPGPCRHRGIRDGRRQGETMACETSLHSIQEPRLAALALQESMTAGEIEQDSIFTIHHGDRCEAEAGDRKPPKIGQITPRRRWRLQHRLRMKPARRIRGHEGPRLRERHHPTHSQSCRIRTAVDHSLDVVPQVDHQHVFGDVFPAFADSIGVLRDRTTSPVPGPVPGRVRRLSFRSASVSPLRKIRGQVRESDRDESPKHRLPFQSMDRRWDGRGSRRRSLARDVRSASRRRRSPRGIDPGSEWTGAFGSEPVEAANASNPGRGWIPQAVSDA